MYAVSFRIPFKVMGRTQYINGAFHSSVPYRTGELVRVTEAGPLRAVDAEVINNTGTTRDRASYNWSLASLSY